MWFHGVLLIGVCSPNQWCAANRVLALISAVVFASFPAVRPLVCTTGSTWTASIPKISVQSQQRPILETCPSKVDVGFSKVMPCKSVVMSEVKGETARSLTCHNNRREQWDPMGHSLLFLKEGSFINWAAPHVKSMDTLRWCQNGGRKRWKVP